MHIMRPALLGLPGLDLSSLQLPLVGVLNLQEEVNRYIQLLPSYHLATTVVILSIKHMNVTFLLRNWSVIFAESKAIWMWFVLLSSLNANNFNNEPASQRRTLLSHLLKERL
jgi:hypothetical protein